jgi:hypothetical protein
MKCPCCGTPNIDHDAARSFLSECNNGHEFTWGYAQGANKSHIIKKDCDCEFDPLRIIKERVSIDA